MKSPQNQPKIPLLHSQSNYDSKRNENGLGNAYNSNSVQSSTNPWIRVKTESSGGFSPYVGASSLQHYSPKYSMPKESRFKDTIQAFNAKTKLQLPSQKSTRAAGFGYGEKIFIPVSVIRNAKNNPPPDHYFNITQEQEHQMQEMKKRKPEYGKSFGISFESYRSVYVPNSTLINLRQSKELPGVGTYNVSKESGQDKLSYSLYGPGRRMNDHVNPFPSPNKYSPKFQITENNKFNAITQGKGKRFDFTKVPQCKNPDPQAYDIPSIFDKYGKKYKFEYKKALSRRIQFQKNERALTSLY